MVGLAIQTVFDFRLKLRKVAVDVLEVELRENRGVGLFVQEEAKR